MTPLPEKFEESLRRQLGVDFPPFVASLREAPPVSLRLHPLKSAGDTGDAQVPWCRLGRYLSVRPSFTLDPHFHAGKYYVQEASSMFLEHALARTAALGKPLRVLDLCAAPGGKSTHLLSMLHPESLLVSNETIRSRAAILSENIQKWGYPNAVVTSNDPQDFQRLSGFFDIVVVDAPCSGEGLFRKDPGAMREWTPANVDLCASRQKRIISDVWPALKEGGILVYSTCTYNRLENEDNLRWLRENHAVEFQPLQPDPAWGVEEVRENDVIGYRFFPHRVTGEGFFMSVVIKRESTSAARIKGRHPELSTPRNKLRDKVRDWVLDPGQQAFHQFKDLVFFTPGSMSGDLEWLSQTLRVVYAGTNIGAVKHEKVIPDHALALSVNVNRDHFPQAVVGEEVALRYLRRETISLPEASTGFTMIVYRDLPIGWVNVLANRVNNLYPQEWRIRKEGK